MQMRANCAALCTRGQFANVVEAPTVEKTVVVRFRLHLLLGGRWANAHSSTRAASTQHTANVHGHAVPPINVRHGSNSAFFADMTQLFVHSHAEGVPILRRRDQPVNGITGQAVFDHFEKTVVEPTEEKSTLADPSTFRRIIWVTVVLDEFNGVRVGPYVLTDIMVGIDGGTRVRAGSGVMVPWAASKS
jgi:hypothetical protein